MGEELGKPNTESESGIASFKVPEGVEMHAFLDESNRKSLLRIAAENNPDIFNPNLPYLYAFLIENDAGELQQAQFIAAGMKIVIRPLTKEELNCAISLGELAKRMLNT